MNIYYLGLQKTTVQHTKFFKDYAFVKGQSNKLKTMEQLWGTDVNYNKMENFKPICAFYDQTIKQVLSVDPHAYFIPYNQACMEFLKNKNRVLCTNKVSLIKKLNNKPQSRKFLGRLINCLEYKSLRGREINLTNLNRLFKQNNATYVIQEYIGFAGLYTYLLDANNETIIKQKLKDNQKYSVSVYQQNNISLNNTFIISNKDIIIFDGSYQKIIKQNQLLYDGWDFDKYKKLPEKIQKQLFNQTYVIAKKLQKSGYRGIGGVDYILVGDQLYYMEINPRFQSSSQELDKLLQKQNYPSIFELNYLAFYDEQKFAKIAQKLKKY